MQGTKKGLAQWIAEIHLIYLCLIPAAGTFAVIYGLKIPINPWAFLLIGTAVIGIYLAVTASYFTASKNAVKNLIGFLDAPVWTLLAAFTGGSMLTLLVHDILIEAGGILLGIFLVAIVSRKPSRQERVTTLGVTGGLFTVIAFLVVVFANSSLESDPLKILLLCAGILQTALLQFRVIHEDKIRRDATMYIVIGIVAWVAALCVSYGLVGNS